MEVCSAENVSRNVNEENRMFFRFGAYCPARGCLSGPYIGSRRRGQPPNILPPHREASAALPRLTRSFPN